MSFKPSSHGNRTLDGQPYTRKFESTKLFIKKHSKRLLYIVKSQLVPLALSEQQNKNFVKMEHIDEAIANKRQVHNHCQKNKDDIQALMIQCRAEAKIAAVRFIRGITPAPTLVVFLANDRQLNDMKRFCTDMKQFCVLGVDTTFNCGKFLVTVFLYRHLMLESETAKIGKQ